MNKSKILLTFTTTYERLPILEYTYKSLLKQELSADFIYLNLSKEPYLKDSGCKKIPEWLKNSPIKVNFVENTGSYRKLLPILSMAGSDDFIITVDDDVIYSNDFIKNLVEKAEKYPNQIICARARKMKTNFLGKWQNYLNWPIVKKEEIGLDLLPIGVGGVLYRKKLLDIDFINDRNFLKLAPTNDDLWFKVASLRKKTSVAVFPDIEKNYLFLQHTQSLHSYNNKTDQVGTTFLFKALKRIKSLFTDYIGVKKSPNDKAWQNLHVFCNFKLKGYKN
jgi:hypothetical protein